MPGIGSSVLAARLRQLERKGLIKKRSLPPPAASAVYELTDEALGLARVLAALADWGMNLLGHPHPDDEVRGRWLVLGLAATALPDPSLPDATYELRVDGEAFQVRCQQGHLQPAQGSPSTADATITLSTDTLAAIGSGALDLASRRAARLIALDGDAAGGRRLLRALSQSG
jgi:hypothetical protein